MKLKTEVTAVRIPIEWKVLIRDFQEENDDGFSSSSGTLSAYIIEAIQVKMKDDKLIVEIEKDKKI